MTVIFTTNLEHHLLVQGQDMPISEPNNSNSYSTIDGIPCDIEEHSNYHSHVKLDINIDNKPYPIPENIGIIPYECLYWLHTHDNSGVIHIEAPIENTFTLGQFLNIWKVFDNSTTVEDMANNSLNITSVPTNGKQTNSSFNYLGIELIDNAIISINFTR